MNNPLIFGKDNTQNIVSVEVADNLLYIYKEINGQIQVETREHNFWVVSSQLREGFKLLKGNAFYKYIKNFDTWKKYLKGRRMKGAETWSVYNPVNASLIKDGLTYYKDMKVNDVSVLAFDIEGTGLVHNYNSRTLLISNTLRKNGKIIKKLFSYDNYKYFGDMLEDWCQWVREVDPSIICGHNVFGYDLPYLAHCADLEGVPLSLGRDDSLIVFNGYPSKFRKDGSQQYDYYNANIHGREIIDTMFLSIKYDIKRKYESYALKQIIKHEGLEKENRQYYDASKIGVNYTNPVEWEKIKKYAENDADDALALFDLMIPSYFYYTQAVPRSFQQIINTATGSQINAFMVRSYLQDGYGLPKANDSKPFDGAISMGIPGVYNYVKKVDVSSLYPNIMRQYDVCNVLKDPEKYMLQAVEYFTTERLKNKEIGQKTKDKYYKDLEQSQKIFINSMYGFLGAPGLNFNSPSKAAFITKKGREILLKGVEWATGHTLKHVPKDPKHPDKLEWVVGDKVSAGKGYTLVNVDTDSFSCTDDKPIDLTKFKNEIIELNALYPDKINWEEDGVYDKLIVVKAKNYILQIGENIKYKGSSLTDTKKEDALIEMLHEMIGHLLNRNLNKIDGVYNKYVKEAWNIKDVNRWTVKKTITKSVLNPERTNERKVKKALGKKFVSEGDKVWFYAAISGKTQEMKKGEPTIYKDGSPKMIENRILKLPENWNKDEDKMHYIKRVYKTAEILSNIIDINSLTKYHLKKNIKLLNTL